MRRALTFLCEGATLAATLHPADGRTGLVIVTGGLQTRHGSHRGFVDLADRLAEAGYPVLRFDRRGVGDSDGDDPGFAGSQPDIAAAIAALRAACPDVARVIGWALCDGATALATFAPNLDLAGMILVNPWTFDGDDDAQPPRAAIVARYRDRLFQPRQWLRLLRGGVDMGGLVAGLWTAARPVPVTHSSRTMAAGLEHFTGRVLVILAERDATAQAFAAGWNGPLFSEARRRVLIATVPGATHTFPGPAPAEDLARACLHWISALDGG